MSGLESTNSPSARGQAIGHANLGAISGSDIITADLTTSSSYTVPSGKCLALHGFKNATSNAGIKIDGTLRFDSGAGAPGHVADKFMMVPRDSGARLDVLLNTNNTNTAIAVQSAQANFTVVDAEYILLLKPGTVLSGNHASSTARIWGTLHDYI